MGIDNPTWDEEAVVHALIPHRDTLIDLDHEQALAYLTQIFPQEFIDLMATATEKMSAFMAQAASHDQT